MTGPMAGPAAYQRLLYQARRLHTALLAERRTSQRLAAERDEAQAAAHLAHNLLWLAPYSGRHGIRGDRLLPQPQPLRIPTQHRRRARAAR